MSLSRRLAGAFGASILGPLVSIFVQLVNVPVMLRYWGGHLYGEWLLISTIPTYLLLTELGFGNVAGSDMTIRVSAGDKEGAIETFQSISLLVLAVSLVIGLFLSALIFVIPVHRLLHLSSMSSKETQTALVFLCINSLIIQQWTVIGAAYRGDGRFVLVTIYMNAVRIIEGASFLILLVLRAGPVQLSMLMLAVTLVGTSWMLFMKYRLIPWLPFGVRHFKWKRVQELWRPAAAYLVLTTGGAISLQGLTMMVGLLLGPLAVAVFNPMRTLSRTVFQLSEAIRISVWQELSAAYGQQNWHLARKLHRLACQISLLFALFFSVALAIAGPRIFALWTHGRIAMDVPTFYILLVVVLVNSIWNASSAVLLAANRHQRMAVVYLFCTSLSLLLGFPLIRQLGLRGAGIAMLLCEVGMGIFVVRMSNKLLSERWSDFAASMADTSHLNLLRAKLMRLFVLT